MFRKLALIYKQLLTETPRQIGLSAGALVLAGLFDSAAIFSMAPVIELMMARQGGDAALSSVTLKIRDLFERAGWPFELGTLILILGGFIALKMGLMLWVSMINVRAYNLFEERLKQKSFRAILAAPWSFFAREKAGDLINTLTTECARAGAAFFEACKLLAFASRMIFGFAILLTLSAPLMGWSVVIMLPFVAITRGSSRYAYRYGFATTEANSDLFSAVAEYLGLIKVIKGFSAERQTYEMYDGWVQKYKRSTFKSAFLPQVVNNLSEPMAFMCLILITYVGLYRVGVPLAVMTVFLFTMYRIVPVLNQINVSTAALANMIPSLEKVEACQAKAAGGRPEGGDIAVKDIAREIRFSEVGFSYDPRRPVLRSLNLSIPAGKTVSLAGTSGAGKSTIVDLLMGFNQPGEGAVLVDGLDLRQVDVRRWRELIGYVPQDVVLFNDTLYNNIAWGAAGASREDVLKAAEMAYVREFAETFPKGYDTPVGERGAMLSGGQKQRVALARALIRKPKLLILDEATSNLDAESERLIQKLIESLSGRLTVLIVAHRLSTIRNSDLIHVVEDGSVAESGTYDQLVSRAGLFRRLVEMAKA